jgi:hypothetical protein
MSDVQQGPDWWLASDGKWYPPQQTAPPSPPPSGPPPMAPPPQYAAPYAPSQYASAAPATAPAGPAPDAKPQALVLLAGAAAVIIGAFLPWASIQLLGESVDKPGTDGDGVITLVFAAAAAVLGAIALGASRRRWQPITAVVLAALVIAVAVLDMADIKSRFSDASGFDVEVDIGIGLWLTLAGGIAALVGGFLVLAKTPKAVRTARTA